LLCLSLPGFSFQPMLLYELLSGLALPMNRLKTLMLRSSKAFGMRCSVTNQFSSRQASASLLSMETLRMQPRSASRTRSISLTNLRKIRFKAMRTEAPSFQAESTCTSLPTLVQTTASLLPITTTGQLSTHARDSLVE